MTRIPEMAFKSPKFFVWLPAMLSMLIILIVAAPTISSTVAEYLHPMTIDTDPENMLLYDEPVRIVHRENKEKFSLYDLIVVGIVNKNHENGVFNTRSLQNIHDLANFAKNIQWEDEKGHTEGVISVDLIAPSNVDNIEQGGPGAVKFEWLMEKTPESQSEAVLVREKALDQPILNGSLISENGQSIALYIPITSKGISYKIAEMLRERIRSYDAEEEYMITGLPIAQDTFGVEMFQQMAISTPLASMLIMGLLWYFFRNLTLIMSPMIVAMTSVTIAMGMMVATGNDIHILTSMVPIFVMPIAVLDGIHILSEFYDRYPDYKDRKKTIAYVMKELSMPMLYTTITTSVGFASLALMPLPPLQVLGIFVSLGVILAWFFTMTCIPAYILLMPEKKFEGFGLNHTRNPGKTSFLAHALPSVGQGAARHAKKIMVLVVIVSGVSVYGSTKLIPNDNPINWFASEHELRIADKVLNDNFGGSYMAYLSLKSGESDINYKQSVDIIHNRLVSSDLKPVRDLSFLVESLSSGKAGKNELIEALIDTLENDVQGESRYSDGEYTASLTYLENMLTEDHIFKDPQILNYLDNMQQYLIDKNLIGKSNSIIEIVKTVHRELYSGEQEQYRIPDTPASVAQTLITFQNSHRPQDLWHFVTPDYREANMWMQLKSGNNQDMSKLVDEVNLYFENNPPPIKLDKDWFGLTYMNVIWQDYMITGMIEAFGVTFVIISGMMIFLFRSLKWGMLAMIPLTFSVAVLFGTVGLVGKDLDASTSLFAAISLGLAVDYAIHFLVRSRKLRKQYSTWAETAQAVFGEPARAITRNVIVLGVGFMPLLAAPLIPYNTVGILISSILMFAAIATLIILPGLIHIFEDGLFENQ